MEWNIPGTVLNCPVEEAAQIQDRFSAMFLGGDIVLSQVVGITGLEPYAAKLGKTGIFVTASAQAIHPAAAVSDHQYQYA